ncbi:MAG: hypothetical protein ABJL67_15465 [Sulfitobacter sp.]
MKHLIATGFAFTMIAGSSLAQEDQGLSLMERGAHMFLEGILKEMEPAIDEFEGLADEMAPAMRNFATQMGPMLTELLDEIEDWTAYEAPEVLPNGDIIIRRKSAPPTRPSPDAPVSPAPQIDL